MVAHAFEGCHKIIFVLDYVSSRVRDAVIICSDEYSLESVSIECVRAIGFYVDLVVDCSCVLAMKIR